MQHADGLKRHSRSITQRGSIALQASPVQQQTRSRQTFIYLDVFDFELSTDELATLDVLDTGGRTGDPDQITLATAGFTIPEA